MRRVVAVTGAADGIGAAIVERLATKGIRVIGLDVRRTWLDDYDRTLLQGDVTDPDLFTELLSLIGPGEFLAAWVNNAAVAIPGALHEARPEDVQRTLAVNLEAYFWGCAAAVRHFLESKTGGSIVNVSSIQASHAFPGWAAYIAAKGGVDALTRYVAVEYGGAGVRCNAVSPGNVRTPLAESVIQRAKDPSAMRQVMDDLAPLRRMADPQEIAAAVDFLAVGEGTFINGHTLVVDGGATARCFPMGTASDAEGAEPISTAIDFPRPKE